MKCPNCGKTASLKLQAPEVEEIDIDLGPYPAPRNGHPIKNGTIDVEVLITRACACCGREIKEHVFCTYCDLTKDQIALVSQALATDPETLIEATPGDSRAYQKGRRFGYQLDVIVTANGRKLFSEQIGDSIAAGAFEKLY